MNFIAVLTAEEMRWLAVSQIDRDRISAHQPIETPTKRLDSTHAVVGAFAIQFANGLFWLYIASGS